MRSIYLVCISLTLVITQSVYAASWVAVGDGWYVEKNSSKLNGDIANILMRHISKMDYVDEITFDCKNGIATNKSWDRPFPTNGHPSFLKAQELACRRAWEFWK